MPKPAMGSSSWPGTRATGDTSQLQAVENGGGMFLLADAVGYARLAEPVRFRAAWEQAASLRLRDGDTTVLADYHQHGRILAISGV